jgi:phage/plasmid-associated DNA primase
VIQQFLSETTVPDTEGRVGASALYGLYVDWAKREGMEPVTQTTFGRRLTDLGYEKKNSGPNGSVERHGMRLIGPAIVQAA